MQTCARGSFAPDAHAEYERLLRAYTQLGKSDRAIEKLQKVLSIAAFFYHILQMYCFVLMIYYTHFE